MKRKHEPKQPSPEPIDVTPEEPGVNAEALEQEIASVEDRWGSIINSYGRQALIGFGVLVACIAGITYVSNGNRKQMIADYLTAGQLAHRILSDTTGKTDKPLAKLEELLVRHPELRSRYGSTIAHVVLDGQSSVSNATERSALEMAERAIERTYSRSSSSELAAYREFAEASLLVLEAKHEEALARATDLAGRLSTESADSQTLRLLNQIRIAALSQHLGREAEAQRAWAAVVATKTSSPKSYKAIAEHLQDGAVSLDDYLAHIQ